MEEDDLYGDNVAETQPAQKWHWSFLGLRAICFVGNVANAVRTFSVEVAQDVASHANYQMERDEFEAGAGRELEMLLSEEQS